jgi:hypothetical protein
MIGILRWILLRLSSIDEVWFWLTSMEGHSASDGQLSEAPESTGGDLRMGVGIHQALNYHSVSRKEFRS